MLSTKLLLFLCLLVCISKGNDRHRIAKRTLLFNSVATVMQFSTGLTVPLVLPRRSINLSLVAQANYNSPYNISNFYPMTVSARDREKPGYFDISRKHFYKLIIEFLDSFGLEGEQCLLRSICEISEYPMHTKDEETLLEKIVHFVFTPSLDFDKNVKNHTESPKMKFTDRLLLAEKIGQHSGSCSEKYSDCIISLVDLFTSKYIM